MIQRPLIRIDIHKLRKTFALILLVVISFYGGFVARDNGFTLKQKEGQVFVTREIPPERGDLEFSLFWRIWDILDSNYFDKSVINERALIYGAIRGMVAAVGDPYTIFLAPSENKVVQEDLNGSFEGVGIQIGYKGTQLAVVSPLPESPALDAGVRAGDFILNIKDSLKDIDRNTGGISLPEAVQAIRGPAGTTVTLTLLRENSDAPFEVDIKRSRLNVPSVTVEYFNGDKVAHISVLKFVGETKDEWEKATREVLKKGTVKGIVLDLRNNPGGFLQTSVDIASEFLPNNSLVVVEAGNNRPDNEFRVSRIGRFLNIPTVVLINKGSASASEILAGALRDVGQFKLVGEETFGKGTIQEPMQLDNGSALHITTAKWLTPDGTWVNEDPIVPDSIVEDDTETKEDEQLEAAIDQVSNL